MQLLQKITRAEDSDSLIVPDCLEVVVTGDEVVCLSGECSRYYYVIFRMTRHALDCNRDGNQSGYAPEQCEVVGYSLLPQAVVEVGLVEGAAQFREDMLGDDEVKLVVQPRDKQLSGWASCIRKA